MFNLKKLQAEIIEEFTKNSGMSVITDLSTFRAMLIIEGYEDSFNRGAVGAYHRGKKEIYYCPNNYKGFANDEAYLLSSLFHEIAHATQVALDRSLPHLFLMRGEEVVAETVAQRLMDLCGLSTNVSTKLSKEYIESWSTFADQDLFAKWNKEIDKAMGYILTHWLPEFSAKYKVHKEAI